MSYLGKFIGNHISGASKYLGKTFVNGSQYLGKLNQQIGVVRDKYERTKKDVLGKIEEYNPKLRELAESGVNFLEGEAMNFLNPIQSEAQPLLKLGSNIGRLLQNY